MKIGDKVAFSKWAGNSIVVNCLMAILEGIEWNKESQ